MAGELVVASELARVGLRSSPEDLKIAPSERTRCLDRGRFAAQREQAPSPLKALAISFPARRPAPSATPIPRFLR